MPHSIVKNIHIIGDFKKAETFEISQKYALALNAVFIALFYSSGMPILKNQFTSNLNIIF